MDIDIFMRCYYKKFTDTMSINKGRMTTTQEPCKFYENSLLSYISLLVKSIEEDIQAFDDHVDISRGWTFE